MLKEDNLPRGKRLLGRIRVDIFFILNEIDNANYADDNTPYTIITSNDVNGPIKSTNDNAKIRIENF